jgi:hypothetical protein
MRRLARRNHVAILDRPNRENAEYHRAISLAHDRDIFVAGDVRHGSIKRVASAVGEGSIAIEPVLHYLNRS